MKRVFIFLILGIVVVKITAQKIDLHGVVSVHNSKHNTGMIEYVDGVEIYAPHATATASNQNGQFHLEFARFPVGRSVSLSAAKLGYLVVNQNDLKDVILGRLTPLRIFLAKPGQLQKAQTELYQINREALFAERDQTIERLKNKNKESEAILSKLEEQFGQEIKSIEDAEQLLNERYWELDEKLSQYAEEVAMVNLDFASETYRKAYGYFREAKVREAIEVLEEAELQEEYEKAMKAIFTAKKNIESYENVIIKSQDGIVQIVESLKLEFSLHNISFEYQKALDTLLLIYAIMKESAIFRSHELALVTTNLAVAHVNLQQLGKAKKYQWEYFQMIDEYDFVDKVDLQLSGYNTFYLIHSKVGDLDSASVNLYKALELMDRNPGMSDKTKAAVLNNVSVNHQAIGQPDSANHYLRLIQNLPGAELSDDFLGTMYHNFGSNYCQLGSLDSAKYYLFKGLEMLQKKDNHPLVPTIYNGIGVLYRGLGKIDSAFFHFHMAIWKANIVKHPNPGNLLLFYGNLARMHAGAGQRDSAVVYFQRTLDLIKRHSFLSRNLLAGFYFNYAHDFLVRKPATIDSAYYYARKGLDLRRKILAPNSLPLLASYDLISQIHYTNKGLDSAIYYRKLIVNIRQKDYAHIQKELIDAYFDLANHYAFLPNNDSAYHYVSIGMEKAAAYRFSSRLQKAELHNLLAVLQFRKKQLEKALPNFKQAIDIYQEVLDSLNLSIDQRFRTYTVNLAELYVQQANNLRYEDRLPEALPILRQAYEIQRDSVNFYYYRGCYYSFANANKEAAADFNAYKRLKGGQANFFYAQHYWLIAAKTRDFETAHNLLDTLESIARNEGLPENTIQKNIRVDQALLFSLKGKPQKAIELLKEAFELGFNDFKRILKEKGFNSLLDDEEFRNFLDNAIIESERNTNLKNGANRKC